LIDMDPIIKPFVSAAASLNVLLFAITILDALATMLANSFIAIIFGFETFFKVRLAFSQTSFVHDFAYPH